MFNNPGMDALLGQKHHITIGKVTDNNDPEHLYRVKVKYPLLEGEDATHWCRICTMGAGAGGQGAHWLPEVDDEVLVAFLHGDPQNGIVIGSLWSGKSKPSYSNMAGTSQTGRYAGNALKRDTEAKKNDLRSFSSRKGHELIFNDNASKPYLMIHSGTKHRIVLNDEGNEPTKIEIYDGKEENLILIDTKNKKITIQSKTGDIHLEAKETVSIKAKNIKMDSEQNTTSKAGSNIKHEATGNVEIKAGGQMTIEAGGTCTVKGSTINLN